MFRGNYFKLSEPGFLGLKDLWIKKFQMKTISCQQLRQMIADVIAPTIDEIRATKEDQFFYEFDMPPTDDEIDEFIISSSCFDEEMKKFLFSEVGSVGGGRCNLN